ncbi:protein fmp52, mitochondrial precursor [Xylona heveae TC161]|uniref:Protein fmp52, mitochondrial n=1 Tax=Xylona heveae (strain CBS 132557 / TC161) TaxID=1328760 RepID=A0A165FKZ0_XYLHT|nr:protein fmp52, mitochondrial precursor [Xylona heveae TC161]KZF21097.1 protein fmp52, mitochondrial precursor [Xylona heveae TC161]
MASAATVGSTGLTGSLVLETLLSHPAFSSVSTISRKAPSTSASSSKLHPVVPSSTDDWPSALESIQPTPDIFFSTLGTTRGSAGSVAGQRKIDYDLNLAMAKAAKDAGIKTYVLMSSASASATSRFEYMRMKGELEDAVTALGFEHTVILRPGLIVGKRNESRPPEAIMRGVANCLGALNTTWLKDGWAQDANVIAQAAVAAGLSCKEGRIPEGKEKVWVLKQADIVRLGRTEWDVKTPAAE